MFLVVGNVRTSQTWGKSIEKHQNTVKNFATCCCRHKIVVFLDVCTVKIHFEPTEYTQLVARDSNPSSEWPEGPKKGSETLKYFCVFSIFSFFPMLFPNKGDIAIFASGRPQVNLVGTGSGLVT